MDFIAIDFEIANNRLDSACSIGMAFVENNSIIDEKYYLIQPPTLFMDPGMVRVHGITEDDVRNAPTFDEVWKEIQQYFQGEHLIIAHNAQFDMSVLKNCLLTYKLDIPEFTYACSIPISSCALGRERVSGSLKDRAERFGVQLEQHHHALSDAITCAQLVINCVKAKRRKSLETFLSTYRSVSLKAFSELKHQTTFGKKTAAPAKKRFASAPAISSITTSKTEFDEQHPLYGKHIVFTGELAGMDREEAMQQVVDHGGLLKSGVTKQTSYLVVGTQDKALVGSAGVSSKEKKAAALQAEGLPIKIINEEHFRKLIAGRMSLSFKQSQ
ncbi:exonuclease domain-containing protein [Cytobacillus gottheilii]|uniref:exonuclease domain-containing protein n=1 Tax=Cytobacillus gottheilii TaxID=859144 RepID=UPI0024946BFF|nr:exonuclease domain-containing protein [Cytobacillus gottheilii]